MQFRYEKQLTDDPLRLWKRLPRIPIILTSGDGTASAHVMAMIDSGAELSVFHASLARKLNLDPQSGREILISGISGDAITAMVHSVNLQILGSLSTVTIDVAFADSDNIDALLGQLGFFDQHQIKFERYKDNIEIKFKPQK
jgi:hypothetical protein